MEEGAEKVSVYLERLNTFLGQARAWCAARNLVLAETTVDLDEEGLPRYQARGLRISTADGKVLASLTPVGASIIGAQGRVDLVGRMATHALLYQTEKGLVVSVRANDGSGSSKPMWSGINGDGWYWIEAVVRKARRIDESLFIDLLSDASDHDFQ
jgi:hypothetical protein